MRKVVMSVQSRRPAGEWEFGDYLIAEVVVLLV